MTKFMQPESAERRAVRATRRRAPRREDVDALVDGRGGNLAGVRALLKDVLRNQADILDRLEKLR